MSGTRRVGIVGAGITGLAAAFDLLRNGTADGPVDVTLLEAGGRAGGKLWTVELNGMSLEAGADSFVVRKPWAVDLCRQLGLEDRVVIPGSMGAFVWAAKGLVPYPDRAPFGIPADLGDLLQWPGLTRGPKLRALLDLVKPARKGGVDESLGGLLRRRLGRDVARVMVEPLLAGLHAGDPLRLSVLATFPELRSWETGHGSLLRGARAAARVGREEQGRQPMFASVWGGMSALVERLVANIGADRLLMDTPVSALGLERAGPWVESGSVRRGFDAIILATPAFESARLLASLAPAATQQLAAIPYVSTAAVHLVYGEGTADGLPEGTGFVVPAGRATITACTWVSRKWPHRSFGSRAVLRCFAGRAGQEVGPEVSDADLTAVAAREADAALGLGAEPESARVTRWVRALPQYDVGHLDRVARIEEALAAVPGVFAAGAAFRGVGIADCVRQGREAARSAAVYLGGGPPAPPITPQDDQEAISWTS